MTADFLEKARAFLAEQGLVVQDMVADGCLHRCGTEDKPRGQDGAYVVHLTGFKNIATAWTKNWGAGGQEGSFSSKPENEMTAQERRDYRQWLEGVKKKAQAEQEKRWAQGAKRGRVVWEKSGPASSEHAYLARKRLPAGNLRINRHGQLVVPVMDAQGQLMSLQFIDSKGKKMFLKDGKTQGGSFPIAAQAGNEAGPLLVGEGYATVASACLATGLAGEVAFNTANLLRVTRDAHTRYPGRRLVLLEDNDRKHENDPKHPCNPGVEYCLKAARETGAWIAHVPAPEGVSRDFSDLFCEEGAGAVRKAIDEALSHADPKETWASNLAWEEEKGGRTTQKDNTPGERGDQQEQDQLPFGFVYGRDGELMHVTYDDKGEIKERVKICEHVEVTGRTYGAGKWGYVMQWQDGRGETRLLSIPARLFQTSRTDLSELLADEGLDICVGQLRRFKEFVLGFGNTLPIHRNVDRVGWFENCFVLPDEVIGEGSERVILQALDNGLSDLYQVGGTLERWQEMAALCAGNTRLEFALSLSFSGPLLVFSPAVGGTIYSFVGGSTCGKTTALTVAASVWGFPEKQKRTWRLTDNGLESVCVLFNDNVLLLDELGEVEPEALKGIAYMFAGGTGKTRSRRDGGGVKNLHSWRSVALSSGEVSFATKLNEAGIKSYAGQRVRFLSVPVAREHMKELHGLPSAKALAEELTRRSLLDFGLAGRAFLRKLVKELDTLRGELPEMVRTVEHALCPVNADAQVQRVAQRFALVSVSGQLAQEYGILPNTLNIAGAVQECFNDWLADRGTLGAAEDQEILSRVRLFIEMNGASRFQNPENPNRPCINRVGFVQEDGDRKVYYFFPETFRKEVIRGLEEKRVLNLLESVGWLKRRADRAAVTKRFPGEARQGYYCIVLPEESGDADE